MAKSRSTTAIDHSAEARTAEAAKTARLRALRLAKEADDREAEKTASADKTATAATATPMRAAHPTSSVRRRQKSANRE